MGDLEVVWMYLGCSDIAGGVWMSLGVSEHFQVIWS